jgi:putative transposase
MTAQYDPLKFGCYVSKFISTVVDNWPYERGIELDFSRSRKRTDNAKVKSFNARYG